MSVGSPAARAGIPGETILGDFNGDGIPDAVVLGAVSPNLCSTIVEYGAAPGVYQPPIAFTYLALGGTAGAPDCPDIGVAVDLTRDGRDDVVVGWSRGAPASLNYNRFILTDPSATRPPGRAPTPPRPVLMTHSDGIVTEILCDFV